VFDSFFGFFFLFPVSSVFPLLLPSAAIFPVFCFLLLFIPVFYFRFPVLHSPAFLFCRFSVSPHLLLSKFFPLLFRIFF